MKNHNEENPNGSFKNFIKCFKFNFRKEWKEFCEVMKSIIPQIKNDFHKILHSEKVNFLNSKEGLSIWIPLVILLFVLIPFYFCGSESNNYILYEQFKSDSSLLKTEIEILKPDSTFFLYVDSLKVSQIELSTHNKNLISTLQERESSNIYSIESQIESLRQTQTIYIIIIGVILTVVFRIYGKNEKKFTKKFFIIILLAFLILLFYGLDIHQKDLIMRSYKAKSVTSVALDSLVNRKANDNIWYKIDYANKKERLDSLIISSKPRKIYAMLQKPCPDYTKKDLIQIALYIIPFIIVYISFIGLLYYKDKTSNDKNKTIKKNMKPDET